MKYKYQNFAFQKYAFDRSAKSLIMQYGIDEDWNFTETYKFNFDFVDYDEAVLDRALQMLFFMTAISYYKTFIPPNLVLQTGSMDNAAAEFFTKTYERGLGEFFYVNNLNPRTPIKFTSNANDFQPLEARSSDGLLVSIGGGKDSLVTIEALRDQPRLATWSLNHREQLDPLIQKIGLPHFWVERTWDAQLFDMRSNPDSYNGHIPISAIFACVGTVVSILTGYRDNIVSNESTASEPTLEYEGIPINHQYSKSLEFEKDYQTLSKHLYGDSLRYYSFLRPYTELRIAELFAHGGFDTYKDVFSSCNRAFVHSSHAMSWCGECPKCAFVFLALTPFVSREKLEHLWGGKNLLLDPSLEATYKGLLGIEGDKPLDCVGEVKESRAAMRLAQKLYSELAKYQFAIPEDYDFRDIREHSMPAELARISLSLA